MERPPRCGEPEMRATESGDERDEERLSEGNRSRGADPTDRKSFQFNKIKIKK